MTITPTERLTNMLAVKLATGLDFVRHDCTKCGRRWVEVPTDWGGGTKLLTWGSSVCPACYCYSYSTGTDKDSYRRQLSYWVYCGSIDGAPTIDSGAP